MRVIAAGVVNIHLIFATAERRNKYAPAYRAVYDPRIHIDIFSAQKFCSTLKYLLSFGEGFRRDQRGAEFFYAVILSDIEAVLQCSSYSAIRLLIAVFVSQHPMRGEDVAG